MSDSQRTGPRASGLSPGLLTDARSLFEVPDDVAYFNCASLAPRLRSVTQAGLSALDRMARPWTVGAEDWFSGGEQLRVLFAAIVNATPDHVALVPSVSYGIAVAAANLPVGRGSNVIVLDQQYPSNVYAWRNVCARNGAHLRTVPRRADQSLTEALLRKVDDRTSVIAVPNCHWTDGDLLDLEKVGAAARDVGSALVVDASQSLGAYPLDVKSVQPDFLVTVGYKWLLGPYGLAYLYVDEKWHDEGRPIEETWLTRAGAENFARLVDYADDYRPGARRFDAGEFPQFLSLPMACAALSQLLEWGVDNIQATLRELTENLSQRSEQLGFMASPPAHRAGHLLALNLPPGLEKGLARELADRGVYVAVRGSKIRISPHLNVTSHDTERLIEGLEKLIRQGNGA